MDVTQRFPKVNESPSWTGFRVPRMAYASRAGPEGTQETFTASPGHSRAVLRHREVPKAEW
jgi:hypothetical protein